LRRGKTLRQKRRRKMRKRREENVFEQLRFSRAEVAALSRKSALHRKIIRYAKNRNCSQAQLQKILREPQPRVRDLLRGKIAKFSLEALVNYAEVLDMRPEIRIHEPIAAIAIARACGRLEAKECKDLGAFRNSSHTKER
jgi:predicted XRE-type DNA-binding protein